MANRPALLLVAGALFLALAVPRAGAAEAPPVDEVLVSDTGPVEISRPLPDTPGRQVIDLEFEEAQLGRLLQSLRLAGEGLEDARIEIDPPVEAIAPASRAALLASIPGARIAVGADGGARREGRLLGVERGPCGASAACEPRLTLLGDAGDVTELELVPDLAVEILDADLRQRLAAGLSGARGEARRRLRVIVAATNPRGLRLAHRRDGDPWRASYRIDLLADGGVRLQGWAIVSNASAEDWTDVALTLASGSWRSIDAGLGVLFGDPIDEAPAPLPRARLLEAVRAEVASDAAGFAAETARLAPATEFAASDRVSRFRLPGRHDIPAGGVAAIPFLERDIAVSRRLVFAGGRGREAPEIEIELRNELPVALPEGVAALHEEGLGHAGDARLPSVPPGALRALSLGPSPDIRVFERWTSRPTRPQVEIAEGLLRVSHRDVVETVYEIDPGAAGPVRGLAIDHPVQAGFESRAIAVPAAPRRDGEGREVLRLSPPEIVEPTRFRVEDVRRRHETVALIATEAERLAAWLAADMDEETRGRLRDLVRLKREAEAKGAAILEMRAGRDRAAAEQRRLAELIGVLPEGSAERGEMLRRILAVEEQIAAIDGRLAAAETARGDLEAAFAARARG